MQRVRMSGDISSLFRLEPVQRDEEVMQDQPVPDPRKAHVVASQDGIVKVVNLSQIMKDRPNTGDLLNRLAPTSVNDEVKDSVIAILELSHFCRTRAGMCDLIPLEDVHHIPLMNLPRNIPVFCFRTPAYTMTGFELRSPEEANATAFECYPILEHLSMKNLCLAGGAPLQFIRRKISARRYQSGPTPPGDIDLFPVIDGLELMSHQLKIETLNKCYAEFITEVHGIWEREYSDDFEIKYLRNKHCTTVILRENRRWDATTYKIQYIHRGYKNIKEVVLGFDLQPPQVVAVKDEWGKLHFSMSPAGYESIRLGGVVVDVKRFSGTIWTRLHKYNMKKRFDIYFPGMLPMEHLLKIGYTDFFMPPKKEVDANNSNVEKTERKPEDPKQYRGRFLKQTFYMSNSRGLKENFSCIDMSPTQWKRDYGDIEVPRNRSKGVNYIDGINFKMYIKHEDVMYVYSETPGGIMHFPTRTNLVSIVKDIMRATVRGRRGVDRLKRFLGEEISGRPETPMAFWDSDWDTLVEFYVNQIILVDGVQMTILDDFNSRSEVISKGVTWKVCNPSGQDTSKDYGSFNPVNMTPEELYPEPVRQPITIGFDHEAKFVLLCEHRFGKAKHGSTGIWTISRDIIRYIFAMVDRMHLDDYLGRIKALAEYFSPSVEVDGVQKEVVPVDVNRGNPIDVFPQRMYPHDIQTLNQFHGNAARFVPYRRRNVDPPEDLTRFPDEKYFFRP